MYQVVKKVVAMLQEDNQLSEGVSLQDLSSDFSTRLENHIFLDIPLSDDEKKKALNSLKKATKLAIKDENNIAKQILHYVNLSRIQYDSGSYEEAYRSAIKARDRYFDTGIRHPELSTQIDTAILLSTLGDPDFNLKDNTMMVYEMSSLNLRFPANWTEINELFNNVYRHGSNAQFVEAKISFATYFLNLKKYDQALQTLASIAGNAIIMNTSHLSMKYWEVTKNYFQKIQDVPAAKVAEYNFLIIKKEIGQSMQKKLTPNAPLSQIVSPAPHVAPPPPVSAVPRVPAASAASSQFLSPPQSSRLQQPYPTAATTQPQVFVPIDDGAGMGWKKYRHPNDYANIQEIQQARDQKKRLDRK